LSSVTRIVTKGPPMRRAHHRPLRRVASSPRMRTTGTHHPPG
jgi:hypothetical protein